MDQNRLVVAGSDNSSQDCTAVAPLPQVPAELRSLDDWELVLAGGGEVVVCW